MFRVQGRRFRATRARFYRGVLSQFSGFGRLGFWGLWGLWFRLQEIGGGGGGVDAYL